MMIYISCVTYLELVEVLDEAALYRLSILSLVYWTDLQRQTENIINNS